ESFDDLGTWMDYLAQIQVSKIEQYSAALRGVYLAQIFARKLVERSALLPQLFQAQSAFYRIRWIPALLNTEVADRFHQLKQLIPEGIVFRQKGQEILTIKEDDHLLQLLSVFLGAWMARYHGLNPRVLEHPAVQLFFRGSLESFSTYEEQGFAAAIQLWLNKFFIVEKDHVPVIQVQEEQKEEEETGVFALTIGIADQRQELAAPIPLEQILSEQQFQTIRINVLRDLALLAEHFPAINQLVADRGRKPLRFEADAFVGILFKVLPTIRLFGIKVLLPKALRKLLRPQVSMSLESKDDGVVATTSLLNLQNLLNFQWQIAIGDQLFSEKEFLKLVQQFSGIVKLNDQYVFFDEKEIKHLIQQLRQPPAVNAHQLLQVALTEEYNGAKVQLDAPAQALMKHLLSEQSTPVPKGLQATLRPYQLRGYEWLYKNARLGLGSLIADDMGLGKTLQVIATLLKWKEEGGLDEAKAMVIVPTTLLTNWEKEIAKFAPVLTTHVYHGPNRSLKNLAEVDVLLTTYGVVRSETSRLLKLRFAIVVIDEAQQIKNPSTAQTKAVKKITAPIKIAMSGTPVENRLSEYWSIFDFTNKAYLGNLKQFKTDFARPIELDRDQERLAYFRQITAPFIMRRLKSDKSIIQDLPDKIEKDEFCQLTPEQAALYENVVDTTMKSIEAAATDSINRKGLILKLITALKQICNHPTHFLKKGKVEALLSGKSKLLFDLLHRILEQGEKTLIFTQYQEMGRLLVQMLEKEFGQEVPFLHGGLRRQQRDELVDRFQNNRATRILILSLKAGGTGLNLTAASNVIHYDLWWNPAVEAQATDRAYRIGQQRKVMVHRFITEHTFEEKINQLLESKKELANLTVSTGEKWIGELSNRELRELVRLE
ncbi:MAG: DEAD/DEAH box helicase, partial [Bacteroidota bacterium]